MKITRPCYITSRLMAGIDVGNGTLSVEYGKQGPYGRHNYNYAIDVDPPLPNHPCGYENDDLEGLGNLQDGLTSLLSFLNAAAEAYRYTMTSRTSENEDLFPPEIMEWAYVNQNEIEAALWDLEAEDLIEE